MFKKSSKFIFSVGVSVQLLLTGCANLDVVNSPKVGMDYEAYLWSNVWFKTDGTKVNSGHDGNAVPYAYIYVGKYKGGYLYQRNPSAIDSTAPYTGGVVVTPGAESKVIDVVSTAEIDRYRASQNQGQSKKLLTK